MDVSLHSVIVMCAVNSIDNLDEHLRMQGIALSDEKIDKLIDILVNEVQSHINNE